MFDYVIQYMTLIGPNQKLLLDDTFGELLFLLNFCN